MASERTRSRGPRRGQGRRTIYWEISDPFGEGDQVQLYVREAGALGWAKNQGSILGSSWEGAGGDDFAYTSVSYYDGWLEDARDEYPNVRFRQLEYSPPRSWIQARDQAIRNRRAKKKRTQREPAKRGFFGSFGRKRTKRPSEEELSQATGAGYSATIRRLAGRPGDQAQFREATSELRALLERVEREKGPEARARVQRAAAEGAAEAREHFAAGHRPTIFIRDRSRTRSSRR